MAFFKDSAPRRIESTIAGGLAFIAALAGPVIGNAQPRPPGDPSMAEYYDAREAQWQEEARMKAEDEAAGPEGSPGRRALDKKRKAEACGRVQERIKKTGILGPINRSGLESTCPSEVVARVLRENQR